MEMRRVAWVLVVLTVLFGGLLTALIAAGSQESLAEFQAIRTELGKIDLSEPAVKTTGWDNVSEAEWPFFALTYFGYSGCNLVEQKAGDTNAILGDVRWSIEALMTDRVSGFVSSHFGSLFAQDIPRPSVLVHGHVLYLMLRYREISGDKRYDDRIHGIAKSLIAAYAQEPSGILPSYSGMWWPTDNLPALAGLKKYDVVFKTTFSLEPSRHWVSTMRTYYLDPKTGLICGYIRPESKKPLGGPRGVALMFSFPFLREVDESFAKEQYFLAKKALVGELFGLKAVREYPEGQEGKPDVDSGEIIMGFGQAASGLGIAAAAAMDDQALHQELIRSKEMVVGMAADPSKNEAMVPVVGRTVILFGETYP